MTFIIGAACFGVGIIVAVVGLIVYLFRPR